VGSETHGVYIDVARVENDDLSPFVISPDGKATQKKVWSELAVKLEAIQPGITKF